MQWTNVTPVKFLQTSPSDQILSTPKHYVFDQVIVHHLYYCPAYTIVHCIDGSGISVSK